MESKELIALYICIASMVIGGMALDAFNTSQDTEKAKAGCSQVIESGRTLWKCSKNE